MAFKATHFALFLFLATSAHAVAGQQACRALLVSSGQSAGQSVSSALKSRYGVDPDQLEYTSEMKIPVLIRTSDAGNLRPNIDSHMPVVRELKSYDAVVVGGGPSGLTSALYLAEAGKSVLILERNPKLGGLGMGHELKGVPAGGGAAYSTGPDGGLEYKVFQKIGLGRYKQKLTITEPIDSYLWKGRLYKGVWEDHTLKELPASFKLFKHALLKLAKQGAADGETAKGKWADSIDMATLVRQMPEMVKKMKDANSQKIYRQFIDDGRLSPDDPMDDVIDFLDLYGRSALGGTSNQISGRMFVDFYESEITTRYTGTLGTGTISEAILKKLAKYPNVSFRTSAGVASVENTKTGTRTLFVENGRAHEVRAKKVVYAIAVNSAPHVIKGLRKADPEKYKTISEMETTDYAVHVARVKGHPFRATYDTWVYGDRDHTKPSDFILGRWQDPGIKAYKGMRDFSKDPKDDYGVITIYQPMGKASSKHFGKEDTLKRVEEAVLNMKEKLGPIVAEDGQKIEVELVETYRWPESIHIVSPGFLKKIPALTRPTGNIHYVNNTVGAPELESSLARGASEALKILAEERAYKRAN